MPKREWGRRSSPVPEGSVPMRKPCADGDMREKNLKEMCEAVRQLADRDQHDPLARCIAEQLSIVLRSLLGLDAIAGLLACQEPG